MIQQHSGFMRWTSRLLMLCMLTMGVPSSAWASMVGTDQVVDHAVAEQARTKLLSLIDRDDVRAQLQSRGVSATEAKARVSALTDDEVAQASDKLDQLPAGGEILGLLFTVFIVLLITDILGFTKVFPFTHAIKR